MGLSRDAVSHFAVWADKTLWCNLVLETQLEVLLVKVVAYTVREGQNNIVFSNIVPLINGVVIFLDFSLTFVVKFQAWLVNVIQVVPGRPTHIRRYLPQIKSWWIRDFQDHAGRLSLNFAQRCCDELTRC